jgi:hypothetical protein
MKGKINAILVFLLLPGALTAAPEMAVLPFQVSGQIDLPFTEQDLPDLFAEATHFIFDSTRDFRVQDPAETRRALKKIGFQPDHVLGPAVLRSICRETRASRIFTGEARFLAEGRVSLSATVLSCQTEREAGRSSVSGQVSQLQPALRDLIRDAAPFAPERQRPVTARRKPVDLVLVIDASGSMEEDYRALIKSLHGIREKLPSQSRIGAVVAAPEGLDILPLTESWTRMIQVLEAKRPAGDVSIKQIEDALGVVENFRDWKGDRKLLVPFDAKADRRMHGIESRIRRLTSRNIDVSLFQLQGQTPDDQAEIRRISKILRLSDPGVLYGRRAGFVEGFSIFLVQNGLRFYRSERDVSGEISTGRLGTDQLLPIETIHYKKEDLNLRNLPQAYAKRENLRLVGAGPVVSGIEGRLRTAMDLRGEEEGPLFKVLVKHEGRGMWLRISDAQAAQNLRKSKGQKLYLGLSFDREGRELINEPSIAYPRAQGKVPRLFVTSADNLSRGRVSRADVHFLLCEIMEVESPDGQDLRSKK